MLKVVLQNKELPYAIKEELKTLRTNIQLAGDSKKVILCTSCIAEEGKSKTTLNLARSMATLDKTVLLVDADLRKSVLKKRVISGKFKMGLSEYLAGNAAPNDVLYQTEQPGVYVIPAGKVPPNPSELLSSKRMVQMLDSAREQFDYVFIDSPPLGLVVDASVIAVHSDAVILLVAAGEISYRFVQEVVKKLRATQCPILGVVLNKVASKKSRYYSGKKYGKYYKENYEHV